MEQMHGNGLTEQFEQGLLQLDMIDPDGSGASGLVFKGHPIRDHHEYIAMEKALEKYDVERHIACTRGRRIKTTSKAISKSRLSHGKENTSG
ncbi:MAG: hypothetical protein MUF15_00465 [Acidobacteria bacterium]|nr:hypothetical protein [Acidobacteriota bacterium]